MFLNPISITASTKTLTKNDAGALIKLNRAAGITVTLPAASGSGRRYFFLVETTVTSNNDIIQVANATDVMTGVALQAADGGSTVNAFETAADTDTITFNGTTTGGIKGDFVELWDASSGLWYVRVTSSGTGTEATCFSAAVS